MNIAATSAEPSRIIHLPEVFQRVARPKIGKFVYEHRERAFTTRPINQCCSRRVVKMVQVHRGWKVVWKRENEENHV